MGQIANQQQKKGKRSVVWSHAQCIRTCYPVNVQWDVCFKERRLRAEQREEFQLFFSIDCWGFHVSQNAAGCGRLEDVFPTHNSSVLQRDAAERSCLQTALLALSWNGKSFLWAAWTDKSFATAAQLASGVCCECRIKGSSVLNSQAWALVCLGEVRKGLLVL